MGSCFSSITDDETIYELQYSSYSELSSGFRINHKRFSVIDPILPFREDDSSLIIGSWNIKDLGFLRHDNNKYKNRESNISEIINEFMVECDVILLQELINDLNNPKMNTVNKEFLGQIKSFNFTMSQQDTGNGRIQKYNSSNKDGSKMTEHFGILYNPLKLTLLPEESQYIEFWNKDGTFIPYPGKRIPFMFVFQKLIGYGSSMKSMKYYFINIHMSQGKGEVSIRKLELKYISLFIKQLPFQGIHAFIVGDTNFDKDVEIIQMKEWFPKFQFSNSWNKTNVSPNQNHPFDNIIHSDYYSSDFSVVASEKVSSVSDHYPIVSILQKKTETIDIVIENKNEEKKLYSIEEEDKHESAIPEYVYALKGKGKFHYLDNTKAKTKCGKIIPKDNCIKQKLDKQEICKTCTKSKNK
jgi:hypothetical protein